jgi:hypothetical protein
MWKALLSKQDEKMVIEKERVAMKKKRDDLILTAGTSQMDNEVRTT